MKTTVQHLKRVEIKIRGTGTMKKQHNLEVKSQTFDEKKLEVYEKVLSGFGHAGVGVGIVKIKEKTHFIFFLILTSFNFKNTVNTKQEKYF